MRLLSSNMTRYIPPIYPEYFTTWLLFFGPPTVDRAYEARNRRVRFISYKASSVPGKVCGVFRQLRIIFLMQIQTVVR